MTKTKILFHTLNPLPYLLVMMFFLAVADLYAKTSDVMNGENGGNPLRNAQRSIETSDPSEHETIDDSETNASENMIRLQYRSVAPSKVANAVSFLDFSDVENIGNTNFFNNLSGRLPGVIISQRGSIAGNEWARVLVRGQNSFNVNHLEPLILLDGVETDISIINPYTIKSITVLKDASATALYGFRGASGVILIESERGEQGPLTVRVNTQGSVVQPFKVPSFLDSYRFAQLRNEASINDGNAPIYSDTDMEAFRSGEGTFSHPNNDWVDMFLLDHTYQTRNNISISGADQNRSYYFFLGNVTHTGIFNVDPAVNTYNTNTGFHSTDFQTRVTFNATPKLTSTVDLKARLDVHRTPGKLDNYENRLFSVLYNTPAPAMPVFNPDGSLGGTLDYRNNMYGELNYAGYTVWKRAFTSAAVNLSYDMGDWLEGMQAVAKFGYMNFADHITDRTKNYAVFQFETVDNVNQIGQSTSMSNFSIWGPSARNITGELGLLYNRNLGEDALSAGLLVDRLQKTRRTIKLPRVYQSVKGFGSYALRERYIVDVVFSYMGSEQFPSDKRYGFFPAASLAWVVSNEDFLTGSLVFDLLKVRASYGISGNDFDSFRDDAPYFGFLENFSPGMGYRFGFNTSWEQGFFESNAANAAITWQETTKFNAGISAAMFSDRFSFSADYFHEESRNILVFGANTALMGYDFWIPAGVAGNQGVDASLQWQQQGQRAGWFARANVLYAQNKITEQMEPLQEYDWMMRTGHPIASMFGYTFMRFFTEEDDINDFPDHTLLGQLQPGSMIYKDLNNDGVIDARDMSFIANPDVPELYFGITTGFHIRNFDFNVHFQGIRGARTIFGNPFMFEFSSGTGNVMDIHQNRWTEGSGQQADYPALSVTQAAINRVNSTFWVTELDYLRIKTAELGYTFSPQLLHNYNIRKLRIYLSAYNLHTWDNAGPVDPDYRTWGSFYPMTRYFSAGLNLVF